MLRSSHAVSRRGFTLVEILVVIAIIAILVALTAPALMRVMGGGTDTDNKMTISDLELALTEFQRKHGQFPPSKIRLAPRLNMYAPAASVIDRESLAFLNHIFPRLSTPLAQGGIFTQTFAGQGVDWSGGQAGFRNGNGIVLEGDQCLVFFLGGIPTGSWRTPADPPGCLGFSTNPLNPADVFATPANPKPERNSPFFNFKANRLYSRTPAPGFYSYRDSHSEPKNPRPYAYFSAGRRENGYNPFVTASFPIANMANNPALLLPLSDCPSLGVWPYAVSMMANPGNPPLNAPNPPNALPRYEKSNSFQIISAGRDGKFGLGTVIMQVDGRGVPLAGSSWSSTSGWAGSAAVPTSTDWVDDQTNFHPGILGSRGN